MNTGFLSVGAKLLGHVVEHSLLSTAAVMRNEYSYTSTSSVCITVGTWTLMCLNIYPSQRQTRLLTMSVMILESPL